MHQTKLLQKSKRTIEQPQKSLEQQNASFQHPLIRLQHSLGNYAISRWLQAKMEARPSNRLDGEEGRTLEGTLRSRMESSMGTNFSSVRVHTDADTAKLSSDLGARAFTVGEDIVFGANEYKPGTPAGDALIAHELAHVVQQRGGKSAETTSQRSEAQQSDFEKDATLSAAGVMASLWGKTTAALSGLAKHARPRMKAGLSLQRCGKNEQIQAPSYLGPDSLRALEEINRQIENFDLLSKFIAYGSAIDIASSPLESAASSGLDVSRQAEALRGLPEIRRNRINQVIELLLIEHENDMNEQEKAFWRREQEIINRAPGQGGGAGEQ